MLILLCYINQAKFSIFFLPTFPTIRDHKTGFTVPLTSLFHRAPLTRFVLILRISTDPVNNGAGNSGERVTVLGISSLKCQLLVSIMVGHNVSFEQLQ